MKKAILIITTIVLAVQLTLLQPIQSQAVGVDTVVKLVGGKAVVRALAEKAGMTFSKKQLDNVTGFIEQKTFDGDSKAIEFATKANSLTSSGSSLKDGFKKYLLDPGAWLLGLDLIFLAVGAFQDGYEGGTPVPLYQMCLPGPEPIDVNRTTYPYVFYYTSTISGITYNYLLYYSNPSGAYVVPTDSQTYFNNPGSYSRYQWENTFWKKLDSGNSSTNYGLGWTQYNIIPGQNSNCATPVTESDLVDTTNISNIQNHFDNDTYNQNTVYNIEIEMPDNPNYDDLTAWNEPDQQLGQELEPVIVDDEPEEKPVGSSWWEWLLKPLKAIGDFILGITDWLLSILIPSADSVSGIFTGISDDFKAKLPIADQLGSFFGEIEKATIAEATAPTFNVTMPLEWGGGTFSIIDFSYFAEWRTWILNFIRFTAWFIFLKRLYNRIPKMIY